MLQSLGLKSTLITDGKSPINLFDTAHGLIGGLGYQKSFKHDDNDGDNLSDVS